MRTRRRRRRGWSAGCRRLDGGASRARCPGSSRQARACGSRPRGRGIRWRTGRRETYLVSVGDDLPHERPRRLTPLRRALCSATGVCCPRSRSAGRTAAFCEPRRRTGVALRPARPAGLAAAIPVLVSTRMPSARDGCPRATTDHRDARLDVLSAHTPNVGQYSEAGLVISHQILHSPARCSMADCAARALRLRHEHRPDDGHRSTRSHHRRRRACARRGGLVLSSHRRSASRCCASRCPRSPCTTSGIRGGALPFLLLIFLGGRSPAATSACSRSRRSWRACRADAPDVRPADRRGARGRRDRTDRGLGGAPPPRALGPSRRPSGLAVAARRACRRGRLLDAGPRSMRSRTTRATSR